MNFFKKEIYKERSDESIITPLNIIIRNLNLALSTSSTITNVSINGVQVNLSNGSFPVVAGETLLATAIVNGNDEITIQSTHATDNPVRVSFGSNNYCQISSGSITLLNLNLIANNTLFIDLGVDGSICT